VAGLGNPGDRYTGTRHNAGFEVIDAFARTAPGGSVRVDRLDCRALTGRVRAGQVPVLLAKPQTYMNLSGESVKGLLVRHEIPLERFLVVVDDAALPVGRLRIRASGSSGGQKGLQNIIDCLGTNVFPRLRLGVAGAHLSQTEDLADYVLSRFSKAERSLFDGAVENACSALESFLTSGLETAMNTFNRPPEEAPAAH
jgi:PTH1 family peptidyl-tRNA hydrolase